MRSLAGNLTEGWEGGGLVGKLGAVTNDVRADTGGRLAVELDFSVGEVLVRITCWVSAGWEFFFSTVWVRREIQIPTAAVATASNQQRRKVRSRIRFFRRQSIGANHLLCFRGRGNFFLNNCSVPPNPNTYRRCRDDKQPTKRPRRRFPRAFRLIFGVEPHAPI